MKTYQIMSLMYACLVLGFLAGTWFTESQKSYMDSTAALIAAEKAGAARMAGTVSKILIPDMEKLK